MGHSCGVLFGGTANDGANAGLACAASIYAPSNTSASVGSHLCFKIGFDNMKQNKRMTALPLGKKIQANLLKVLVGTPVVWATENSD
nr:MAG: hypothetical protein [Bacteriophage sp.]